jgi:hypothetical protein
VPYFKAGNISRFETSLSGQSGISAEALSRRKNGRAKLRGRKMQIQNSSYWQVPSLK